MKTSELATSRPLGDAGAGESSAPHRRFVLLVLGGLLLFAGPLWSLAVLAEDSHYTHTLVVPLAVAYLLFSERRRLFAGPAAGMPAGVGLVLAGLLAGLTAALLGSGWHPVDRLALQIAGLVILVWGAFLWSYGPEFFRRALFPLLLLVLMIPFPTMLLDDVVYSLQVGSAEMANIFFKLSGAPFFRDGLRFELPGVAIVIAPECSGIRSTMALLITGLIANYWFLTRWWTRTALVALLFPLVVFKNGLRIATLTLLSIWVDPGFLSGGLHTRGGYVFFLISLGVMGLILLGLRQLERRRT